MFDAFLLHGLNAVSKWCLLSLEFSCYA
uniref:Uncharacterized protein n=1 Tax=Rhizophora mucronata TaxID=61149 RepID=A0A2P2R5C4_RHIMU